MAFAYDMPMILITLGFIFIIETLSDIIQVTYFKLTHGKRVFKMAPFHHHLEMGGWTGKSGAKKSFSFSLPEYLWLWLSYHLLGCTSVSPEK